MTDPRQPSIDERLDQVEERLAVVEEVALAQVTGAQLRDTTVGVLEQNHRRVAAVMAAKRGDRRTA